MTTTSHAPDPEFLEHLEWQLTSAHRRRVRFARPVPTGPRWLRATGLAAASFLIGAACVATREHAEDEAAARVHVERASAQVEIAQLRHDAALAALDLTRARDLQGLIESGAFERARLAADRSRVDIERARLYLDEVRATGLPPREDVGAPLVEGRDFVLARLQLELDLVKQGLAASQLDVERLRLLFEQGVVPPDEVRRAAAQIDDAERERLLLERKLQLRHAALDEGLDAERAELLQRLAEIQSRADGLSMQTTDVRAELERRRALVENGVETVDALRALELALATLEIEHDTARVEQTALEQRLATLAAGGDR